VFWFGTRDFLAVPDSQDLPLGCNGTLSIVRISETVMPTLSAFKLPMSPCTIRIVTFERSGPNCGQSRWYGHGVQPVTGNNEHKATLNLQPKAWNPWFFETFYNSMQCDILVHVSVTTSIIVKASYGDPVVVVAESASLRALSLQPANPGCDFTRLDSRNMHAFENLTAVGSEMVDPSCFTSVLNAGQHRLYARNLSIAAVLSVATNDGVLIQGLTMPTDASAYFIVHNSALDVITADSPRFDVVSENDAVCLVDGQASSLAVDIETAQVEISAQASSASRINSDNVLNMTHHSGRFPCTAPGAPGSSGALCRGGRWNVFSTGTLSSVGIHRSLRGAEAPPSGPDRGGGSVFQGGAFVGGRYAFANHSDLVRGAFDYAYISVEGLGMMDGGFQVRLLFKLDGIREG
jgi:hypothetical protein